MANTTNFGWETPDDTDLVKDGAAAMRTLGNSIDTSMVDLKGGTSGQILAKNSNTDMDFVWIANDQGDITGVTASSPLTGGGSSGAVTVGIQDGTTTQKGAVQLENSTSSTSTTTAAVPASVKSAYDLADGAIAKSLVDAKGDLLVGSADNTVARLAVGTNNYVLTADSSATNGIKWAAAGSGGGLVFISKQTFTSVSAVNINSVFTSTYKYYKIIWDIQDVSNPGEIAFRLRASGTDKTTSTYKLSLLRTNGSGGTIDDDDTATYVPCNFGNSNATGVGDLTLYNPELSVPTYYTFNTYYPSISGGVVTGRQTDSTSYDGITFYPINIGDNITGTILIYGYSLS